MKQPHSRNFLIRSMPFEVYQALRDNTKINDRSKNQETIVAMASGLNSTQTHLKRPIPHQFISLAVKNQLIVVTEDKKVLKKCPNLAIHFKNFLSTK